MFSRNKAISYIDKWNKIGQSTKPIDLFKATKLLTRYFASGKFPQLKIQPNRFLYMESPVACESHINCFRSMNLKLDLPGKLGSILEKVNVRKIQKSYIFEQIQYPFSGVYGQILFELSRSMQESFNEINYETTADDFCKLNQLGNFNYYYCGILDYLFSEVLKPDQKTLEYWNLFKQVSEELHFFFIFRNTVYICEKPVHFHLNQEGQLHKDLGPSYGYSDGISLYFLNGVRVPEEIVVTPREKLDGKLILTEVNAEIRKEIIRKIGIEKVINDCGAEVVETSDDGMYELLKFYVPNSIFRTRYYLKMRNPSVPVYHIEGVAPDCDTIQKALNFRSGGVELNPRFMA